MNVKLLSLLRLLLYAFLISRLPHIPDGFPDALRILTELIITSKFLGFALLGLWILTLANVCALFCSHCYFVPFNASLNMLRKRTKLAYEPLVSLLVCIFQAVFLFFLYLEDPGYPVYLYDNYLVLNSLCFRVILFTIHSNNFIFSLGIDMCQIVFFWD